MNIFILIILILILLLILVYASSFFVKSASSIAKHLNVPEYIIGATIVAFGTSLPELIININSSILGHSHLAVSNIIGSNIANICLITGIAALIGNIKINRNEARHEIPSVFLLSSLFIFFIILFKSIPPILSIIFLLVFLTYTIWDIVSKRKAIEGNTRLHWKHLTKNILIFLISLTVIIFSGKFLINYTIDLAKYLGIAESILGITLIAIGSSLPELVTTIVSVTKKKYELGIGNILGSNLFNLLFILPISSLISQISLDGITLDFIILLIVMAFMLFISENGRKKELTKVEGLFLVISYILFILINILILK